MANIFTHPLHLGLGAKAILQPEFTSDMDWYMAYAERNGGDGAEGRLVSAHRFTESWDSWEMHPFGDEVVICTEGQMTVHQEHADGSKASVTISAGDYAINPPGTPPGTWHTADIEGTATALFITAGMGTEHRPR